MLFAVVGFLLALIGVLVGVAVDFWWLLWAGLAVSALGISLWLVASSAVARIFGILFAWFGVAVAVIGLLAGLTGDFWLLLWIGIGLSVTGVLATFCGAFLASSSDHG